MRYMVRGGKGDEEAKMHVCASEEIAQAVVRDLKERYNFDLEVKALDDEEGVDEFHFDLGGSIMGKWKPLEFDWVGPDSQSFLKLSFFPHQLDGVVQMLQHALKKPRAGGLYVKVHGRWNASCIPLAAAQALLDDIVQNHARYQAEQEASFQEWDLAVKNLAHPNVVMKATQRKGGDA